jgi:hypothetical protein
LASGCCWSGQGFTRKKSASGFWKAKLIFIPEKKDKGQSTPPKLLKSKIVRKAKM